MVNVRVVLVSDCYLPRLGGIETQVAGLAHQLDAAGHEVHVLTATGGPELNPASRGHGVRLHRLVSPVPLPAPINPWAGDDLDQLMAGADVVHAHLGVVAPFSSMAIRRALAANLPVVVTWHSMVGAPSPPGRRRRWQRWVANGALPATVSGPAAAQLHAALGDAEVHVIPNGVDADLWVEPARAADRQGAPHLVSAQRFAIRKRPFGLMKAVYQARQQLPHQRRPTLTVAGSGRLLGLARVWVRVRGWDWAELPGRLAQPQLAALYSRSDVYLNSSRKESFGIAAAEALAAGLPVLGYANTGVVDIIAGGHGWVAQDQPHFVARLRWALESDKRLSQARPTQSQQRVTDWSSVLRRTEALYRRARVRVVAGAEIDQGEADDERSADRSDNRGGANSAENRRRARRTAR